MPRTVSRNFRDEALNVYSLSADIFFAEPFIEKVRSEDGMRRLKAVQKNRRKENDCIVREQNWPCCQKNREDGREEVVQMRAEQLDDGEGMDKQISREWPSANSCILSVTEHRNWVTLRKRMHRTGVPLKCECANSVLRVMGDSLSSKFDFRPIISEKRGGSEERSNGREEVQ